MATRQVIISQTNNGVNNATQYLAPMTATWDSVNIPIRVPYQLKLKQLSITTSVPAGSGNTWTYEVLKNGSTCGMQIVITGAAQVTGEANGNVTFGVDDTIVLQRVPASAPDVGLSTLTWTYDMQGSNTNAYLSHASSNATQTFKSGVMGYRTATTSRSYNPSPIAGTLTKAKYNLSAAPTAGKSWSIGVYKNDVLQDGTAGTPDTRVVIADSATSGEWSGSLTVAQGDIIEFAPVPTGSPTAVTVAAGFGFTPTTDGESCFGWGGSLSNIPTTNATYFGKAFKDDSTAFGTTESVVEITIGGTGLSFNITKFYWSGVLSISNSPVLSTRRNQANPSGAQSITCAGTSGNDTAHTVAYVSGDEIGLQLVISGSPGAARAINTGLAMFAKAQAGQGAGKGNKGGGGVGVQVPGGATSLNVGNAGVGIEGLS